MSQKINELRQYGLGYVFNKYIDATSKPEEVRHFVMEWFYGRTSIGESYHHEVLYNLYLVDIEVFIKGIEGFQFCTKIINDKKDGVVSFHFASKHSFTLTTKSQEQFMIFLNEQYPLTPSLCFTGIHETKQ
jgi:hypothetical protein